MIKIDKISCIILSIGFSALLTSHYYFEYYNIFSRSTTFIDSILDVIILFFVNYLVILFLFFLLKFIKKFSALTFRIFYSIFLSFFCVIILKTIF